MLSLDAAGLKCPQPSIDQRLERIEILFLISKARRRGQRYVERCRKTLPKRCFRSLRLDLPAPQGRKRADQTGPVRRALNEFGAHGIEQCVGDLVEHFGFASKHHRAVVDVWLPHHFIPSSKSFDAFGELAIEPAHEVWQLAANVCEDEMIVVAHDAECMNTNSVPLRGKSEAIEEERIEGRIWPQQKVPPEAASRDEICCIRQNAARERHDRLSVD